MSESRMSESLHKPQQGKASLKNRQNTPERVHTINSQKNKILNLKQAHYRHAHSTSPYDSPSGEREPCTYPRRTRHPVHNPTPGASSNPLGPGAKSKPLELSLEGRKAPSSRKNDSSLAGRLLQCCLPTKLWEPPQRMRGHVLPRIRSHSMEQAV